MSDSLFDDVDSDEINKPSRAHGVSKKDRHAYLVLMETSPLSANEVARRLGITEADASARLHRLYLGGFAEYRSVGSVKIYEPLPEEREP